MTWLELSILLILVGVIALPLTWYVIIVLCITYITLKLLKDRDEKFD